MLRVVGALRPIPSFFALTTTTTPPIARPYWLVMARGKRSRSNLKVLCHSPPTTCVRYCGAVTSNAHPPTTPPLVLIADIFQEQAAEASAARQRSVDRFMSGKHADAVAAAAMDAPNGEASPRVEAMEEQEAAEYLPVEDAADLVPEELPAAVRRSQRGVVCLSALFLPSMAPCVFSFLLILPRLFPWSMFLVLFSASHGHDRLFRV